MRVSVAAERATVAAPGGRVPVSRSHRIAVGADNSYWGRMALRWAAEHAGLVGAELEVHAAPPDPAGRVPREDDIDRTVGAFPLLPLRVVASDNAVRALVDASTRADLVVLGCRGDTHHGIGLGAAVLPVAEDAHSDVLVVGGRPEAVRGAHNWITVLLGTPADQQALHSAGELAALRRVPLRILRPVPLLGTHPLVIPVEHYFTELNLAAGLVRAANPALRVVTELVWTNPYEAATYPASTDVLVVGVADRLDPTARAALFHSPNPVLIARAASSTTATRPADATAGHGR